MKKILLLLSAVCILVFAGCAKTEEKPIESPKPELTQPAEEKPKLQIAPPQEEPPQEAAVQMPEFPSLQEEQTPFLSAEWLTEAPENAYPVHADENGEKILLKTEIGLKNVNINRVQYNEETKEYEQGDRVWWMAKWEPHRPILLEMKAPVEQAQMEISWEDEFTERERRLIQPVRVFQNGTMQESVLLVYYVPPFKPLRLTPEQKLHVDLDGDTVKETIVFSEPTDNGTDEPMALLRVTAGTTGFEYRAPLAADCTCYLADLDSDGCIEIYLSGADTEANAKTYCRLLTSTGIAPAELHPDACVQDADGSLALRGRIETVADGILYLTDRMELLGKRTAHTAVTGYSGVLQLLDGVWDLDRENGVRLRKTMTVAEENGTKTVLAAGKTLYPVQTDGKSFAVLETDDGLSLRVAAEPTENGWMINGEKDSDLFELG